MLHQPTSLALHLCLCGVRATDGLGTSGRQLWGSLVVQYVRNGRGGEDPDIVPKQQRRNFRGQAVVGRAHTLGLLRSLGVSPHGDSYGALADLLNLARP